MASSLLPQEPEVTRLLQKLKREPITADGMQDSILAPIYTLLMKAPPVENCEHHWFCNKAKPVVVEAATFLLRLYAYTENPRVELWKKRLAGVLHSCCGCVQGFSDAKISSRETYFGAFSKPTLDTFFGTLEKWEVETVLKALEEAGITPGSATSLSDVPTAILYHMLTTIPVFFENVDVLRIFPSHPPAFISSGWPVEVPPGVLLLLFHDKNELRIWAQQQIVGSSPILDAKFCGSYEIVFQAVTAALTSGTFDSPSDQRNRDVKCPLDEFFVMSSQALWSGLHGFLRILPLLLLRTKKCTARQFCQAIVGHLHDTGPHFPDVLRAFVYLVKTLSKSLWDGEDSDYPQIVFDSIKDNTAFTHLIQHTDPNSIQQPWFLDWFHVYICSLWELPIFEDVLRKFVSFMCEELQHERFKDKRAVIMACVLSTLQAILQSAKTENDIKKKINAAVVYVLDIHADVILTVALSLNPKDVIWHKPQAAARQLLYHALSADATNAETTIFQISNVVQLATLSDEVKPKYNLHAPLFHKQMWNKLYDTVDTANGEGIALLISLVAPSAYLDTLSAEAFDRPSLPSEISRTLSTIIVSVNEGLKTIRAGFLSAITQYTNSTSSTPQAVQSLMAKPDMAKYVVGLLLSPVDDLQLAAQNLLGHAYDVDVRSDCFRALLQHFPVPSLNGIATFMTTFNNCALILPEACSISKSVVRCMTDVIEVLTNSHDGLLFDDGFGPVSQGARPHAQLPTLWHLMCAAITAIFRRTPLWSKYYDPDVMIDWMRDALIFARDLLAQRRTFESATSPTPSGMTIFSPRKPSQSGKKMLESLQSVLTESIRWLRLTDMELLHQSSSLVQSLMDCFRETDVKPNQGALTKLEKFLDSARRKSSPDAQTRLSETHLSELTTALSFFKEEDDDVQIVGEFKPTESSSLGFQDRPEKPQASRWSGDRQKNSMGQQKLDGYMSVGLRKSIKTGSSYIHTSSASRPRPSVELQAKRGARHVDQSKSLIAQVRSQAVARSVLTASFADRHHKREYVSARAPGTSSNQRRTIKDESVSIKLDSAETSSSSEDSDEDGDAGGLASLGKLQKSPLVKRPTERRTVKLLDLGITGQNPALERIRKREEARREALRMKPDMRPLHRIILSWNYDHDGPEPPTVGSRVVYTPIADSFQSDHDYQSTFEPLLILECWNQLVKSKEEDLPRSLFFRINSRQFIDDWLDLDVSVTDRPPERWRLTDMDVVLLRQEGSQKCVLAKVQSSRMLSHEIQITLRCLASGGFAEPGLQINTQWRLTKVFSLSTIAREYAALKGLPYYDAYSAIMRPRPAIVPVVPTSQVQQAMKSHRVNEPQAIAILGALQVEGFSLIQGPPGTGKTWTICGLVGAFLSSRSRSETVVHAGRNPGPAELPSIKKVLVCAPSNAAIDEVAKRIKDGVLNSYGHSVIPNTVRVGTVEAINISVKSISLDQLVDKRLGTDPKQSNVSPVSTSANLASLREEMDVLRKARAVKADEMSNSRENDPRFKSLAEELKVMNMKRMSLSQQFNRLKDQQKSDARTLDAARRKYRAEVLMEADVICATLSGAGHEALQGLEFEMIIVDEAAQSIELSSLIPLKYRSKRCIMVGDPQQLPPTVLSPLASKYGYNQSLFVRLQKSRPEAVHLLSIQYRMHPDISRLPSRLFYEARLQDAPGMDKKAAQLWHSHPLFGTYKFVNISSGNEQQAHSGHSLVNHMECDIAVTLYNRIKAEFSTVDLDFRIGVITMYRAQLIELRKRFEKAFGKEVLAKVDFNTVDGFQGQEKDIIILSCVRAGPGVQSIGFLADKRRLNVAITRARSSLFILGHAATLERSDEMWKEIVRDARETSRLFEANVSTYRRSIQSLTKNSQSMCLQPVQKPNLLKTLKATDQTKPEVPPIAGPSAGVVQSPQVTEYLRVDPEKLSIDSLSSPGMRKRRSSDGGNEEPLTSKLRLTGTSKAEVSTERPKRRHFQKRPKEVSMFIPKKKPEFNRAAPDSEHVSRGDSKRRLTEQHYGRILNP